MTEVACYRITALIVFTCSLDCLLIVQSVSSHVPVPVHCFYARGTLVTCCLCSVTYSSLFPMCFPFLLDYWLYLLLARRGLSYRDYLCTQLHVPYVQGLFKTHCEETEQSVLGMICRCNQECANKTCPDSCAFKRITSVNVMNYLQITLYTRPQAYKYCKMQSTVVPRPGARCYLGLSASQDAKAQLQGWDATETSLRLADCQWKTEYVIVSLYQASAHQRTCLQPH